MVRAGATKGEIAGVAKVAGKRIAPRRAVGSKTSGATSARNNSASAKATRAQKNKAQSDRTTADLLGQLRAKGCPDPVMEHRFRADRAWHFDLAWESLGVAVEIEGGVHIQGRHSRGEGFEQDAIKYGCAAAEGWTIIRVTPRMIKNGTAAIFIAETLRISGAKGITAQEMPWEGAEEA